jgi:hypothetical protein
VVSQPDIDPRRLRIVGPPPEIDGSADSGDDSARLLVLLGLFTVAVLVVVVALLGAAAIDSWWALVAVLVVHFAMTALSFAGVAYVFRGRRRRDQG